MVALLATALWTSECMTKELPGLTSPVRQSDWNVADRQAWDAYRKDPIGGSLPGSDLPARRFYEAFKVNLKAGAAGEYQNIMQRHTFYDAMALTLHRATDVDKSLRCIRFFDAASDVTASTSLGAAENVLASWFAGFGEPTKKTILAINGMLFAKNVAVMKKLTELRQPFDPTKAEQPKLDNALLFDLKMVSFEQGAIDDFLATRPELRTSQIVAQLSSPPAPAVLVGHSSFGPGGTVARWAMFKKDWLPAAGISNFSFEQRDHRIAMGEAYVFFLHQQDSKAFAAYRKGGSVPSPYCGGVIP